MLRWGEIAGVGRIAQALGVNSVPVVGVFADGWSTGTALALYWVETVLATVFVAARIVLHRRLTRKAGHWDVDVETRTTRGGTTSIRKGRTTYLASFLVVMVPFTVAHGLFLALLLGLMLPRTPGSVVAVAPADLRQGALAVAVMLALGFLMDLVGLRARPFRWVERIAERGQRRIFPVHLAIVLGLFVMMVTNLPQALFAVFAGLKTLVDLGGILPEKELPLEPPAWLRWVGRVVPSKDGETFDAYWRRTEEEQRRRREENERLLPPGQTLASR